MKISHRLMYVISKLYDNRIKLQNGNQENCDEFIQIMNELNEIRRELVSKEFKDEK